MVHRQALIDRGAKVDVQHQFGWTALMFASANNHPMVVRALIRRGMKECSFVPAIIEVLVLYIWKSVSLKSLILLI